VAHATSEDRAEALERRSIAAEAALEQLSSLQCAPPTLAPCRNPDQSKAKARARARPARLHTPAQVGSPAHADPAGGSEGSPRRQRGGTAAGWERRLAPRPNPMPPPSDLPRACLRAQGAPTRPGVPPGMLAEEEAQGSPCRPPRDDLETISRRSRDDLETISRRSRDELETSSRRARDELETSSTLSRLCGLTPRHLRSRPPGALRDAATAPRAARPHRLRARRAVQPPGIAGTEGVDSRH